MEVTESSVHTRYNRTMTTQPSGSQAEPLMKDRVVLVTGASRGIGAAAAKLLAQHGAAVGINFNTNVDAANQVVQSIQHAGGRALALKADVGDAAQVQAMLKQLSDAFGPVDTLVLNAAAVRHFTVAPFEQLTWEQYEDLITGETKAIFIPVKAALPSMLAHKRGCVIAISSGLSRTTRMGMSGHSSGKAAVDALARSLAAELGPRGIRVNVVAPGLTRTDATDRAFGGQAASGQPNPTEMIARMTPLGRIAEPEDIAGGILMLAADTSRFITGAYLPVSGGILML